MLSIYFHFNSNLNQTILLKIINSNLMSVILYKKIINAFYVLSITQVKLTYS